AGRERNFVVTSGEQVRGILLQHDLIKAIKEQKQEVQVQEIMRTDFEITQPDESLSEIYIKIRSKRNAFYPVIEHNRLAGAIDSDNINEFMIFRSMPATWGEKPTP